MVTGNPFVRYRTLLDSYRTARANNWSDADFVALVERLDQAVARVDGQGLRVTPFTKVPDLARAVGLQGGRLWVKNDTVNVAGSHKARHLFGLLLHHAVEPRDPRAELVIASCGNAALAAAVVARATGRRLRVFVPVDADRSVVARLSELGATIVECERVPGERGDPCYARFREAIEDGAVPFSCQGVDTPGTIDGGRTIALEVAEQLCAEHRGRAHIDHFFVQVGGGALASACTLGLLDAVQMRWLDDLPRLYAVQTEAAAPLARAWRLLHERMGQAAPRWLDEWMSVASTYRDELMWPWESTPHSVAYGIVDDVTYDWLGVVEGMLRSGGATVTVGEADLRAANELARRHTAIDVDHTGSAGLAGLMRALARSSVIRGDHTVVVLFTGIRRS